MSRLLLSALRLTFSVAMCRIFVGFSSSPPTLADTVRTAAHRIGELADIDLQRWEELRIGGELLLPTIEAAIRKADLAVFDVTQLNENVLFEFGLALGADKVVGHFATRRIRRSKPRGARWGC
jgi:hypothetical protein